MSDVRERARAIIDRLEFGCPFIPGTLGEKNATAAEVAMQQGAEVIRDLLQALDTEREDTRRRCASIARSYVAGGWIAETIEREMGGKGNGQERL